MFRRRRSQREFSAEIDSHLESETQQLIDEGWSRDEARWEALRRFGNRTHAEERFYEAGRWPWLDALTQDLRYGLRSLRKSKPASIAAMLAISIGFGACIAVWSLLDATERHPLPYPHADRLVWISQVLKMNTTDQVTVAGYYLEWRNRNRSFDHLAAYLTQERIWTGGETPLLLKTARVSANFLPALGQHMRFGRNFVRAEDQAGGPHAVILTTPFWQAHFGGDRNVVGRSLRLDGDLYEVVGILPESFLFPGTDSVDVLTPLYKNEAQEVALDGRKSLSIVRNVVGRLKSGVSEAQGLAELETIQATLPKLRWAPRIAIRMEPLQAHLLGQLAQPLRVLAWAAALLLIVASANVGFLLMGRGQRRVNELTMRRILGASRLRLVCQMLFESALIAAGGALAGCGLAWLLWKAFPAMTPLPIAHMQWYTPGWSVAAFAVLLMSSVTLGAGLVPAWQATRDGGELAGRTGNRAASGSKGASRFLSGVVIVQIACSYPLLVAAGLFMQSFYHLRYQDVGLRNGDVIVATMLVSSGRRAGPPGAQDPTYLPRLLESARRIPGVETAAIADAVGLPPGSEDRLEGNAFFIEGRPIPPQGQRPVAVQQAISQEYFGIVGLPLIAGRSFGSEDTRDGEPTVVVNQALVRRAFPDVNPIGQRIRFGGDDQSWLRIVGMVGDVKTAGLRRPGRPMIYLSISQPLVMNIEYAAILLKSGLPPGMLAGEVRKAVRDVDAAQPVQTVETLNQRLDEGARDSRSVTVLLTSFAGLTAILGCFGIAGILSCFVSWRRRELAIRQALGATRAQVVELLLAGAARLLATGLTAGVVVSLAVSRGMEALLYQVSPSQPAILAIGIALLSSAGLLACWLPVRRASRMDPASVLRAD